MAKKPNAREKLNRKKEPKKVRLEYDFAGIKSGSLMFVGTPQIVEAYVKSIPFGETRTILAMRNQIARQRKCDAMCPVSTAIFVRMVAEAALEELEEGEPVSSVAPFWRLITSQDKVAGKLAVDPVWIDEQRALEARASTN
ncbi:MAG: hypothetical protein AAFX02_04855 [Pseudomonadota bacterium]